MGKRPVLVTLVSAALILSGAAGLAFHAAEFAPNPGYLLIMLVRALAIVAGGFMLRGNNWARWLSLLWISAHVVISAFHPWPELAIHVVVFAVFAFVLFRADAVKYFRGAQAG